MRLTVLVFSLLCASAAQASTPTARVTPTEVNPSGRLRIEVDGKVGWWWPKATAERMSRELEAAEVCVELVADQDSKIEIRDWQMNEWLKLQAREDNYVAMLERERERAAAGESEARAELEKWYRNPGTMLLIGAAAGLVVTTGLVFTR